MDFSALKKSVSGPIPAESSAESAQPPAITPAKEPRPSLRRCMSASLDAPKIWGELIREIKSQRPLINAWVQAGRLLGIDDDQLRVGFRRIRRCSSSRWANPTTGSCWKRSSASWRAARSD